MVDLDRDLLIWRNAPFELGLEVKGAVSGFIAGTEVLAEAAGEVLFKFVLSWLNRFGEVGIAEGVFTGGGGSSD